MPSWTLPTLGTISNSLGFGVNPRPVVVVGEGGMPVTLVDAGGVVIDLSGASTSILRVVNFAALPLASSNPAAVYLVENSTGIWPFRKAAGLYLSNGVSWNWLSNALWVAEEIVFSPTATLLSNNVQLVIEELDGNKANLAHNHLVVDVTGLQALLDGKAASSHTHSQADIVGLIAALAAKADLVGGVLTTSQIPSLAISEFLGSVANQAAMLALVGQRGDWCFRTDFSPARMYILSADNPAVVGSWQGVEVPGASVISVNGQAGVVVLGKADVGLANVDNTSDANKPVSTAQLTALNAKLNAALVSAFGLTLIDDADANAARATLGLGSAALANTSAFELAGAITTAINSHLLDADPHGQYLTEVEADAIYKTAATFLEEVQDIVGIMVAGAGGTYNDAMGTITFPGGGGGGTLNDLATVSNYVDRFTIIQTLPAVGVLATDKIICAIAPHDDIDENNETMLALSVLSAKAGVDEITFRLTFNEPTYGPIKVNWSALQ